MTSGTNIRVGEVVAFARTGDARADDLLGAVVPARLREEPTGPTLDNVVPFVRPRSNDNAKPAGPELVVAVRPAPASAASWSVRRKVLVVTASLLVHGAVFAALWREPPELAGTELEAISVEIVQGNNAPIGLAATPDVVEGDFQQPQPEQESEQPAETAEQRTTEQPQETPVAERETTPAPTEEAKPAPEETAETPAPEPEPTPSVAMVEGSQAPELATEAPREPPPPAEKFTLAPPPLESKPEEKPVERPKAEKPKPKPEAKPEQKKAKDTERKRIAARTDERTNERAGATPAARGSNGAVGRTGSSASYNGQVSAHLQRHKQYPSDARARGDQGTATVAFSLDASGRVTSVRLARSSGYPSLDQEVQAMVRRASPFPAPPDGRGQSFAVPVGFGLR